MEIVSHELASSWMARPGAGRHILDTELVIERFTYPLGLFPSVAGVLPYRGRARV